MKKKSGISKRKSLLTAFLSTLAVLPLSACRKSGETNVFEDVVYRENYDSVYAAIGKEVTLDAVRESADGRAYVTVDNKEYELGMDFLSMAMVYNAQPTALFPTAEAAYNEWWRLYIQRWNWLVPEVPLYSNRYYDVYNAKISDLKTTPYWDVATAIVGASVTTGDSVILGNITELSGAFRNAAFGKSAAGACVLKSDRSHVVL